MVERSAGTESTPDWSQVVALLTEIRDLFVRDGRPDDASVIQRSMLDPITSGQFAVAAQAIASGDTWGHMGSLFDTFLSDDDLSGQFQELQKALAAELERQGLSSDDVRHHVRYMW